MEISSYVRFAIGKNPMIGQIVGRTRTAFLVRRWGATRKPPAWVHDVTSVTRPTRIDLPAGIPEAPSFQDTLTAIEAQIAEYSSSSRGCIETAKASSWGGDRNYWSDAAGKFNRRVRELRDLAEVYRRLLKR